MTVHPSVVIKFIYSENDTKVCEISTVDLSYVVTVKSTVEISQKFLAFSEYMNFNCLYQRRRKFKNLGEANSNRLSLSCLCSLFYSVKIWEGHGTLALCFRLPCSSFPRNLLSHLVIDKTMNFERSPALDK